MSVAAEDLHVGLDLESIWDTCNWDAAAMDALLQLYFYGEVVFG